MKRAIIENLYNNWNCRNLMQFPFYSNCCKINLLMNLDSLNEAYEARNQMEKRMSEIIEFLTSPGCRLILI